MKDYIENKLTFTLTKICVKNSSRYINFENKTLQIYIIKTIDKNNDISYTNIEYPTDAINIFDITSKLS